MAKKVAWLLVKIGTGGGTRTRTELSLQGILSAPSQGDLTEGGRALPLKTRPSIGLYCWSAR